jgi:hypothetical protein
LPLHQTVAVFNQEDQQIQCLRLNRHLPSTFEQAEALHINLDLVKAVSPCHSTDLSIPSANLAENIGVP